MEPYPDVRTKAAVGLVAAIAAWGLHELASSCIFRFHAGLMNSDFGLEKESRAQKYRL